MYYVVLPGNFEILIATNGTDRSSKAFLARKQYPQDSETKIVIRPMMSF